MSRERCAGAKLRGYQGPFYPSNIEALNTAFGRFEINSKTPDIKVWREIGRAFNIFVPDARFRYYFTFAGLKNIKTKDGYGWAVALLFRFYGHRLLGNILVAFPFLGDKEQKGGVFIDRSVAVFLKGRHVQQSDYIKCVSYLAAEIKRLIKICEVRMPG